MLVAVGVLVPSSVLATGPGPAPVGDAGVDPFRPALHFAPEQHWINDPNGPIWYDGRYHLFFQHNPLGDTWGSMSWGHAVSTDLVHWVERPVAIPASEREHVFSGTVVVDHRNTSGFGTTERPAMVAVYTGWDPVTGRQAQSLAYSTDSGETWTRYAANPVLDIGSTEFRDPKVFWYDDGGYWVMAVVLATDRTMRLYRSADLKTWEHLSDFGPHHAVGGVWEMPDLFELPVDGDPTRTRWVLVISLNPGSVAGGSGAQYFVGHFDGTRFVPDRLVDDVAPPPGRVLADFEGQYPADWVAVGDAWGTGPASGTLPGQHEVTGYVGAGLVNSFLDGDRGTGTLTSPEFVLTEPYLNLLVGGGNHPRAPGTGDGAPPAGRVLADFEGSDYGSWTVEGTAFGAGPTPGDNPCQTGVVGHVGTGLANSYRNGGATACEPPPDSGTGRLVSPVFEVTDRYLSFLVGGGPHAGTAVRLVVDGQVVRTASGSESGSLDWVSWDVADLAGAAARIEVVDEVTGGWGHVLVDHVVLGPEPAAPRSRETTVSLEVDGVPVRTATGRDDEALDWVAWDVRDLAGRTARLVVRDTHQGSWGHVLVDHVVASDTPALPLLERFDWVDRGADFYAPLTVEDEPGGRRVAIGWMSNWTYAGVTPTQGWRGAMSVPRELSLRTIGGVVRLVATPVAELADAWDLAYRMRARRVDPGIVALPPRAHGDVLELVAEFEPGTARRFGVHVRTGSGERTVIGYDTSTGRLVVDRTRSGLVDFHPDFAAVHSAPLAVVDGRVRIRVLVDRSSVEVLGGQGEVVITDLVYPRATSTGVEVFAEGGHVGLRRLEVRTLGG